MTVSIGIILILCLYTVVGVLDQISIQIGPYTPLFAATFTGLVLGDVQTGLMIGATLQLMTLGVATYGGATVPDFLSGPLWERLMQSFQERGRVWYRSCGSNWVINTTRYFRQNG